MRKLVLALFVISILYSCQASDSAVAQDKDLLSDTSLKSNNPNVITVNEPAVTEGPTAVTVAQPQPSTQSQPTAQPQPVVKPEAVLKSQTSQAKSYGTNTAPNPAHGQPNHRCDIAVGAPLNSAPTTATPAPSTTITSTNNPSPQTMANPASAPTITPPGMNPPHGQPGHDCSIAVGAPLKKN